jgi:hypothetical protein
MKQVQFFSKYSHYFASILLLFISVGSSAQDISNDTTKEAAGSTASACVIPQLKSDKVPFPLQHANALFDLSKDQVYLLRGKVHRSGANLYFRIDFQAHPFLATPARLAQPLIWIDPNDAEKVRAFDRGQSFDLGVVYRMLNAGTCTVNPLMGFQIVTPPDYTQNILR